MFVTVLLLCRMNLVAPAQLLRVGKKTKPPKFWEFLFAFICTALSIIQLSNNRVGGEEAGELQK